MSREGRHRPGRCRRLRNEFANLLVDRLVYLAPCIDDIVPGSAQAAMYAVGVIEIAAGIAVALATRFGAWLVAGFLAGVIVNLLPDIALREFGLLLGPSRSRGSPSATTPRGDDVNGRGGHGPSQRVTRQSTTRLRRKQRGAESDLAEVRNLTAACGGVARRSWAA